MDKDTADILEALDFIKERMVTKDDLAALRTEFEEFREETRENFRSFHEEFEEFREETRENFASLRAEIRDIRHRLEALKEAARNSAGLTKEIDHLMERVRVIEKHLGLQHKLTA